MEFSRKYGVLTHVYVPMVKRGLMDFAVGADWTPATGDVKISKDGGGAANITTLPVAIAMGNGAMWDFQVSATEMQAAKVAITVVDTATKAVEDQMLAILTYGNASAEYAGVDFVTGSVASVSGAVGSVSGAVANVTGNVGGNVTGSVGSVTGAVGSVTGAVGSVATGGIVAATFAANAINAAAIAPNAIDEATFAADTAKYGAKVGWVDDNVGVADRYLVIYFKNGEPIVAGITSPDVWVFKSDGTDLIGTTGSPQALSQIGATGTYTYNEGTNRLVSGSAYIARVRATIDSATRTWYQFLGANS